MLQRGCLHMLILLLLLELINLPLSLRKAVSSEVAASSVGAWVCSGGGCMPEMADLQDLLHVCEVQGKINTLL